MAHAWLDSLSEDWVSQPPSDESLANAANPASQASRNVSQSPDKGESKGGKPRPATTNAPGRPMPTNEQGSSILSERSLNDINLPSARRAPSKLSQEVKLGDRGRPFSRTVSASTCGSVVHNTVQHKSLSASPPKSRGRTPEWKRRLVYGEVAYGEHKDLFSSAGTGLENIFKPPPPATHDAGESRGEEPAGADEPQQISVPSSPPGYDGHPSTIEIHVDESTSNDLPPMASTNQRKVMNYRLQESDNQLSNSHAEASPGSDDISQSSGPDSSASGPGLRLQSVDIGSRKFSGQSVLENEDLSPIILARHTVGDGEVAYAPAELPASELRKRLDKLRRNQMLLVTDADGQPEGGSYHIDDTEDLEKLGGFINFRRGGRSGDGSFQQHLLSSAITDSSGMLPDDSIQASTPKQFPTIKIFPEDDLPEPEGRPLPAVPYPSPEKDHNASQPGKRSPLKLFGQYDTFTNQTLLRRISQFEDQATDGSRTSGRPSVEAETLNRRPSGAKGTTDLVSRYHRQSESPSGSRQPSLPMSHFGVGHLDGFEFDEDISHEDSLQELDNDGAESPSPPGDQNARSLSPDDDSGLVIQRQRLSLRKNPSDPSESRTLASPSFDASLNVRHPLPTTPRKTHIADGKRPRTSPSKDPTPKRRRTLHKSDIAYGVEGYWSSEEVAQLTNEQMQSIMGKKRKDARPGDMQQPAHANVLAMRQILRPRAPTPSQRSSIRREEPFVDEDVATSAEADSSQDALSSSSVALEAQRKPSIKTEDFIDQANQIMRMIRLKAGRGSGLASLEESQEEQVQPPEDVDSFEESTKEPFDRPPSREGRRTLPRLSTRQEDPEIAAYLQRYEERGDGDELLISSLRSVVDAQNAASNTAAVVDFALEGDSVISDPPNMRISANPNSRERADSDVHRDAYPSNASSNTSGNGTGRSIPTGSSNGSDSRKTIAPQTVSHLIGEQVGGMIFDKQRNIWVKRKKGSSLRNKGNTLASEASEDDPFLDIPDLTVDMTMELQHMAIGGARDSFEPPRGPPEFEDGQHQAVAMPVVNSAEPSAIQTNDADSPKADVLVAREDMSAQEGGAEDAIEHEIMLHEGRATTPKRRNLTISFSSPIASVIEDILAPDHQARIDEEARPSARSTERSFPTPDLRQREQGSLRKKPARNPSKSRRPSNGAAPRPVSLGGHAFIPRPVSRIDERDEEAYAAETKVLQSRELSVLGDRSVVEHTPNPGRQASLSFVITTPARVDGPCPAAGVDAGPVIAQYVGRLSLSPLSEFTAHGDDSVALEASYIIGNHHLATADGSKRVIPLATGELVEKLAEIEPFEPYWDDMQDLDLHGRQISSLQLLDEFCGGLVRLDASRNAIRNLAGIPGSVRELKISHNALSNLTSWAHLLNLQYVDVSDNALTSLSVFKNLVHLRSLRADRNQLTSLDDIKHHDGLQLLRARGNLIEDVNFDGSRLHRLAELDLRDNKISTFENVDQLPCLTSLNLDKNELGSLELGARSTTLPLRYLNISDNRLACVDVSRLASLRLLHADRNHISHLSGFAKARRLDSLSLREQRGGADHRLDLSFLSSTYELRKLYLSGNPLGSFAPPMDYLNLQLLELANCGLASLPADLGQMMPNLRVVNLNLNALPSLSPLRYVPRLKRLLAAGNRLASANEVVDVVADFPYLATLDLRDNPLTQGFYPPATRHVLVRTGGDDSDSELAGDDVDPFKLPEADVDRDAAFAGRLDLETAMRRRVYEMALRERCRRLRKLDGLPLRERGKERRLLLQGGKDAVWLAMAAEGLIVNGDGSKIDIDGVERGRERSGRWEVENSFA